MGENNHKLLLKDIQRISLKQITPILCKFINLLGYSIYLKLKKKSELKYKEETNIEQGNICIQKDGPHIQK